MPQVVGIHTISLARTMSLIAFLLIEIVCPVSHEDVLRIDKLTNYEKGTHYIQ